MKRDDGGWRQRQTSGIGGQRQSPGEGGRKLNTETKRPRLWKVHIGKGVEHLGQIPKTRASSTQVNCLMVGEQRFLIILLIAKYIFSLFWRVRYTATAQADVSVQ